MKTTKFLLFVLNLILFVIRCESPSNISVNESIKEPELYRIDTLVSWTKEFNPYVIKKDVEIYNGGELVIEPGVKIFLYKTVVDSDPAGDIFRFPIIEVKDGSIICKGNNSGLITMRDSSDENLVGFIRFNSYSEVNSKSVVEGIEAQLIQYWDNRDVFIYNSTVTEINILKNSYTEIINNTIGTLTYGSGNIELKYSDGIIQKNHFQDRVFLLSDSLLFTGNYLENTSSGLKCALYSKTRIIGNTFQNCNLALAIFYASPLIHQNNIYNNELNLMITPDWENPQFDTIYAINNWWGTTDTSLIYQKIFYELNGTTTSQKHVEILPVAELPFDLH